jgi:carboxypeptidase C (cathepsin A)
MKAFVSMLALGAAMALVVDGPVARASEPSVERQTDAGPREELASRDHKMVINGKTIAYKATAGTLVITDDDGVPRGSIFYTAYTAQGARAAGKPRPLTFFNNGGPGSASLWLNVGGFGPKRPPTLTPRATLPAPYVVQDNPYSLLDKSDLIFIDAIGTGYSRPIGDTKGDTFWGVDADIDSFARAINRYITKNDRWNSPRYLFGESYGTTRSAGLVYKLQNQGMDFNGVVLMSTILNSGTGLPGVDLEDIGRVPSFAATAWYHGKSATHPTDLMAYLDGVRAFALGPYASALLKGDRLSAEEMDVVARTLSGYIGLSVDFLKKNKLRVGMEQYRSALMADQGLIIGRFDTRFTAPASYVSGDGSYDPATNDAATAGVNSAHLSTFQDHLARDIGYKPDLQYRPLYNGVIAPAWDNHHKAPGIDEPIPVPNTALDLAGAMQRNPNLKVMVIAGLYDLATPFAGAEFDVSHLYLTPNLRGNISFSYYESGHMTYVDEAASRKLKVDLDRFYDATTR